MTARAPDVAFSHTDANLIALARSFPTLAAAVPFPASWDPRALDRWASGPAAGAGAVCAARFVLQVYNSAAPWRCGVFNVVEAMSTWDAAHRAAFMTWARAPWFP